MAIAEPFHRVWLGFGGLHGHRGTIPSRMAKFGGLYGHRGTIPSRMAKFGGLCGRRGTVPSLLALIKVIYSYYSYFSAGIPSSAYYYLPHFYLLKGYTTSLAYFKGPNAAITMLHIY